MKGYYQSCNQYFTLMQSSVVGNAAWKCIPTSDETGKFISNNYCGYL